MKSLKQAYKNYFKVGAAVSAYWLDEAMDTIKENFDTVTAENEMKFNGLHSFRYNREAQTSANEILNEAKASGKFYTPDGADKIYNFVKKNGLGMRGHTLAWHSSYPHELFERMTAEELESCLCEHFDYVSRRYPDCFCWDVVNEAVDDKHDLYLRDTVFKRKLGDDYLIKIYSMAREYFPNAQLICNDYNEFIPTKRENILRLVNTLKENGIVDGIGCQAHLGLWMLDQPDAFDNMRRTYELYAATGLRLHVTEMDVSTVGADNPEHLIEAPEKICERVAAVYDNMFRIFREYSEAIDSVTFWGVCDRHSWLNSFRNANHIKVFPLLFDENYQPKEAFYRITEF